jgi:hypothetical protein
MSNFKSLFGSGCLLILSGTLSYAGVDDIPLPDNILTVNLSKKVSIHNGDQNNRNQEVASFSTPEEGRPWVAILGECSYDETENEGFTGIHAELLPSEDDVREIKLTVWADKYRPVFLTSKTCAIRGHFKVKLSPNGVGMQEIVDRYISDQTDQRRAFQLNELGKLEKVCIDLESDARVCFIQTCSSIMDALSDERMSASQCVHQLVNSHDFNYKSAIELVTKKLTRFSNKWQHPVESVKKPVHEQGLYYVDEATIVALRKLVKRIINLEKFSAENLHVYLTQIVEQENFDDELLKAWVDVRIAQDQMTFAGRECGEILGPLELIIQIPIDRKH